MKRLTFLAAIIACLALAAYSQHPAGDSTRQLRSGEVLQFGDGLSVRVTKSQTSQFTGVKLKGTPVVVTLDFDSGKKATSLSYKLTADPKTSDLYLSSGAQKLAPLAVVEDFPSWGKDNDKEVEVIDPKESGGGVVLSFGQKGSVSLLFDVPAQQAKTPLKFSMKLRTVAPVDEQHSFVVSL
jgi:hypothetical protein